MTTKRPGSELPIIFILGPSGAGKSTLGQELAKAHGFLHIETDSFQVTGMHHLGLQDEWAEFETKNDAKKLADAIRSRAVSAGKKAAVMTFSSVVIFSPQQIIAAESQHILIVVPYGSAAECISAFLKREKRTRRDLDLAHWLKYNAQEPHATYIDFSLPEYARYRLEAFTRKARRRRKTLANEVLSRL